MQKPENPSRKNIKKKKENVRLAHGKEEAKHGCHTRGGIGGPDWRKRFGIHGGGKVLENGGDECTD